MFVEERITSDAERQDAYGSATATDTAAAAAGPRLALSRQLSETGFPATFAWGSATAAYQVEGAADADGKGESIWDRFTRQPGAIVDGSDGRIACDHYHRWRDDLDLIARLGLGAYAFSVAWTRILPTGSGKLNAAGLDFYEQLVDGLLARGVTPYLTLYHWDLPQALQERGGWRSRDTAAYCADYAHVLARRLGDRVHHWVTINEPRVVTYLGHVTGEMAPGLRDPALIAPVAHHLLLAHGLAMQAIRAATETAQIGAKLDFTHFEPATDREEDAQAMRLLDGLEHRWFLDPLLRGSYPDDINAQLRPPEEGMRPGDLDIIHAPIDFLGVNYYSRARVRATRGDPTRPERLAPKVPKASLTTMGWEVYPEGLYETLMRLHTEYAPQRLYVMENGAAYRDSVTKRGEVHDRNRVAYFREHLLAARAALAAGAPLDGYFAWSLLDNFEWAQGYTQRFGIVAVDYATQQRMIKQSGQFLARVAATNGGVLQDEE